MTDSVSSKSQTSKETSLNLIIALVAAMIGVFIGILIADPDTVLSVLKDDAAVWTTWLSSI